MFRRLRAFTVRVRGPPAILWRALTCAVYTLIIVFGWVVVEAMRARLSVNGRRESCANEEDEGINKR